MSDNGMYVLITFDNEHPVNRPSSKEHEAESSENPILHTRTEIEENNDLEQSLKSW